MAYQTGTASGPAALLNSLATFASSNGWSSQDIQAGKGFTSPDGATFALVAGTDSLAIRGCVGLSSSKVASEQPGAASVATVVNAIAGPFAGYTFFAGNEDGAYYLHGVIEAAAGIYKPFAIGRLVKFDSTVGGEYASAVNWFYGDNYTNFPTNQYHDYLFDSRHLYQGNESWSHVRANLDGKANNWMRLKTDWEGNNALGIARADGLAGSLISVGYQRFNKLVPILPIYLFGDRPSNLRSPLGYVPHLRLVDLRLLEPKQIITIGTEEWQVFPAHQRTLTWDVYRSTIPSSAYNGYAFRRIM
ncbi:hypothetical protein Xtri_02855 [Xanthomonas campestris pv. trichodesmae]|uniref:Phage tail protein n=3 Tax=Xanthomonas citri TaxID=346 RepID=A0AB33CJI9_XANCI|nr:hypothetical protein XcvCFBP7111P_05620 [Xanthomonas citri pv. vignicola]MBZ3921799.1 hypothetical protein [Xanthomonas campestris pv. trichodesmae]MBZ3926399.1 hypothetical protein [Xanthomonas citri pv. sesbaniae]